MNPSITALLTDPRTIALGQGILLAVLGNLKRDLAAFHTYKETHPDATFDYRVAARHASYAAIIGAVAGLGLTELAPAVADLLTTLG